MGGRVGLGGGGVRVDVNKELKFLGKFKKKIRSVGGGGGGVGNGMGVRVDVDEGLKFFWGIGLVGGSGWIRTKN